MRDLSALPKVHLHVHLESTIRPGTLKELAVAHGVQVPDKPAAFDGFRAFADRNSLTRSCLREGADFERIAREFCADEAAQGTRYVEVTFTAASHGERIGDFELPLNAVLKGLWDGGKEHGLQWRLILDHSRRRSVERAEKTLELAKRHEEIVAIGMAGEEKHSLAPFREVFVRAREAGLHLVHHAGEDAGPDSIREAIEIGGTERIGHGIRILEDPELTSQTAEAGIALEVCPSSNVALGLVPTLPEHPLPQLIEAGLSVTLNTDVPDVTGTTITDEFTRAREVFGYDDATLAKLASNAVQASFAPEETKALLRKEIDGWLRSAEDA
ncbi:adenosine deaminase [Amycolatopsis echigonensis]|uniref:Adenosine deaminase n=1 Tax=Amycolatopsis echigonensis TaxID=2576905 RepID=A0A8E2B6E1_9PSEU|nr:MULTISPECIES: adenosine deaminase [Amycolatopsis]MBB2502801.1 adenosine deaminase [Amycolatopsis echigonensis]